jgi:hypothetical protein
MRDSDALKAAQEFAITPTSPNPTIFIVNEIQQVGYGRKRAYNSTYVALSDERAGKDK